MKQGVLKSDLQAQKIENKENKLIGTDLHKTRHRVADQFRRHQQP
jgi:hypothetical protein